MAGAPTSGGRTATFTGVGCVGNTGTLHASHGGRNYQGELLGRALLARGDPHLLESCCRPRCHAPCISAECCLAGVPPAPCLRAVREMRPACAERDPQRGARRAAGSPNAPSGHDDINEFFTSDTSVSKSVECSTVTPSLFANTNLSVTGLDMIRSSRKSMRRDTISPAENRRRRA